MKKKNLRSYIISSLIALAVGGLSALLTGSGMEKYACSVPKPAFSPPPALFPIVWTILYILMGIGAAIVYSSAHKAKWRALTVYAIQLAANFLWSIFFFGMGAYGFAFFWLLLLIALVVDMTVRFYRISRTAGLIQIPYVLWLCFAAVLNFAVWQLNR